MFKPFQNVSNVYWEASSFLLPTVGKILGVSGHGKQGMIQYVKLTERSITVHEDMRHCIKCL